MERLARFLPILHWGRTYDRHALTSDAAAAVIVTIMLIPQSLAYAMLAGLPQTPSRHNPVADPERAQQRQRVVLKRMFELGKITEPQYRRALAEPLRVVVGKSLLEVTLAGDVGRSSSSMTGTLSRSRCSKQYSAYRCLKWSVSYGMLA